ncbi:alpha/beta fold hydrolase [Pinirhizobacter soli]|uniref:alpha/beta fold hydrolase n=1 Tax=Pinirhizobacter soli TaxID=2786953 RepID=UPI00202A3FBB|nr:alpha/beta hydrolase [Pinirhizobacter soli]
MNQSAKITLVLLPGMDGTGDLFQPFMVALEDKFLVKVVTYPCSEPLGYSDLESIVRSALPADGPFVILGESFSGPIAISVAASHPQGLMGLILCCTFARNPRPRLRSLGFLIGVLPAGAFFIRSVSGALLGRFSTRALREMFLEAVIKVTPETLRARLKSVLSVDATEELAAIDVPVLYLRAGEDAVVPTAAVNLVKSIQSGMKVVEVDAPHLLLQAAPGKAAQVISEFVDAIAHTQPIT